MSAQPERPEDPQVTVMLAGVRRDPGDDGAVTRSGRCPDCGYLYDSPGHKISCDGPAAAAGIEAVRLAGREAWDIHHARSRG